MRYHFKVHKEKKGYWAECVELDGCFTQGDTKDGLQQNMEDALNLYLLEPEGSKALFPLPRKSVRGSNIVKVQVQPEIAFAFMVRYHRIKSKLTQKQAAKKLGVDNLYSYQRLEKKCNARLDMLARLKELFPKFSLDMVLA